MNKKEKRKKFNQIVKNIKDIKIQGATNIAKKALYAYFLVPTKQSKNRLLNSRPTEPMMENVLELAEKGIPKNQILSHFKEAQDKINKKVFRLIKKNDVVFTHCHSKNVVNALIYAKKKGKKFEVYNTETRPLFQGRKTAHELKKAGIKVTMFVDSALGVALSKEQGTKKADRVFLGADAILKKGIINKIGSEVIANIARDNKIPVYIIADSWKFTKSKIPLENRKLNEVWNRAPKKIRIKNPAFEFVDKKYITKIITEKGK
jgi:translation initiation factor 2B subunit (eIF-2B alpha/beta/delta family)